MKRASQWVLRIAAGVVMFLALGGPAPGNIGGCGSAPAVSSPRTFCTDREFWKCRRDQYAERIDDATADACYRAIEGTCSGFNAWPAGCAPTPAQTDACINLLQRADRSSIPTPELLATYTECNLCM